MKIETVFQIVAVAFAGAAVYFLWSGNKDGTFISVVFGCVAFFLSVRFQVKRRNQKRKEESLGHELASSGESGGSNEP